MRRVTHDCDVLVAAWDEAGTVLENNTVTLPAAASAILGPG